MKVDLKFAAVSRQSEEQLRLAADLMAAQGLRVVVSPWDGTRCDVLVVDAQDTYGQHALNLARRRPVKIVALAHAGLSADAYAAVLAEDAPASDWARALARMLGAPSSVPVVQPASEAEAEAPAQTPTESVGVPTADASRGLCRLALDPDLRGKDLLAQREGLSVVLASSRGRVVADSEADLARLRAQLALPGWTFSPVAAVADSAAGVSASLDAFYVDGALAARDQLPPFPHGTVRLSDWPDLGGAPALVDALKLVRTLLRQAGDVNELAASTQVDGLSVSACLWAFSAADLLRREDGLPQAAAVVPPAAALAIRTQTMDKLARRFGLGASST